LCSVKGYESEDEHYVRREDQAPSEHRAVFRVAPEVEKMAQQKQETGRSASKPTPSPDKIR
jgi:hypothetical protein